MVTANSAPRFKDRSIMSDSYVEKYLRAKKRHRVVPQCLFGSPSLAETDAFFLQQEINQMKDTKKVYKKYDLSEIADGPEKDDLFPNFDLAESGDRIAHREVETNPNVKFQPKIVTESDRPPADNLFEPIEKPSGAVAGVEVVQQADEKLTDYWQTSKRRRSSNCKEDSTNEDETDAELHQNENNVTEDQNPQE